MSSSQDQEEQNESLVDFIYVDKSRILSYIAQLFDDGPLQALSKTHEIDQSKTGNIEASLSLFKGGRQSKDSITHSEYRVYDSSWAQILDFISSVSKSGKISDIYSANLGQFVQLRGNIKIRDMRLMDDVWNILEVMGIDSFTQASVQKAATKEKRREADMQRKLFKYAFGMLQKMPQPLTLSMTDGASTTWASLAPENMTINPMDFIFKHGTNIAGEWSVIGVLDGVPEDYSEFNAPLFDDVEFGGAVDSVIDVIKQFGRPSSAYAITPLVLYRNVSH